MQKLAITRNEKTSTVLLVSFFAASFFAALAISLGLYFALVIPTGFVIIALAYIYFHDNTNAKYRKLFIFSGLFYIAAGILWPRYVAIWLPGLPSINLQRIASISYLLLLIIGIPISSWLRYIIRQSISQFPFFWLALGIFVSFRIASAVLSPDAGFSIYQLINELSVHVSLIFLGLALGESKSSVTKLLFSIITIAFVVCFFIGLTEWILGKNLFARFVDPENAYVRWAMSEKLRGGGYRAQSTFGHPLTFAEFSASCFCIVMYIAHTMKNGTARILAMSGSIVLGAAMVFLSESRAGYGAVGAVGALIATAPLIISFVQRQLSLKSAALWSLLLIFFAIAFAAVAYIIYDRAFGAHAHQQSNSARVLMYQRGLKKSLESPIIGFGVGRAADLVGTPSSTGVSKYSIDSLYVSYLIESGYLVLISHIFILLSAIIRAFRLALFGSYKDSYFWLAIGAALVACFVFKFVLSLIDNNFLFYCILGICVSRIAADDHKKRHQQISQYYPRQLEACQ